jgi:phosphoenolpyruvate carboxykinase (GTP)
MESITFETHNLDSFQKSLTYGFHDVNYHNQLRRLLQDHEELLLWILEIAHLTTPDSIYICKGHEGERQFLIDSLVATGTLKALNPEKRPHSYLALSDPDDVARVEDRTFVCTPTQQEAGPNNNWIDPSTMKVQLKNLFKGSMKGRTLYVLPFCMGPFHSPYSRFGVQITDSAYVALSMGVMTRMGEKALSLMKGQPFVKALHSVGYPLWEKTPDVTWPCHKEKYIAHFPESQEIWSFGSGYGGNALLGKKCFALRLASFMAQKEGWLAEHMLIMGAENSQGEKNYVLGAFPSACGKTNFAMMVPPSSYQDWKITTVGDDIAWIHRSTDGSLRAINPEYGFFGVAPGTNYKTNPVAMETIRSHTVFTNVALTPDGDVWWEGLTENPPPLLTDWLGQEWTPHCGRLAAHPNSRFTVSLTQCPTLDECWNDPEGVKVSALIFGGRRQNTLPLVFETRNWEQGVYFASTIGSETTSAATGTTGLVRRDPMAMLPFCGYNMAEYFNHWLALGKSLPHPPKIFLVNWFKKDSSHRFVWPGFGDNMRVLEWILSRCKTKSSEEKTDPGYSETPLGLIPSMPSMNLTGLESLFHSNPSWWNLLMDLDTQQWELELLAHETFFKSFGLQTPLCLQETLWQLKKAFAKKSAPILEEKTHHFKTF